MITKKVNRYWCEFCKKTGGSAGHMKRHESGCTKNPNRICKMCQHIEGGVDQKSIAELIALLPDASKLPHWTNEIDGQIWLNSDANPIVNAALPALRAAANDCPACIMAALRQAKIPVSIASDFDYKKEVEKVWELVRDANGEGRHP